MIETGGISKSQYKGTTKSSICIRCNKDVTNMSRQEQDLHEIECKKQTRLF